MNNGGGEDCEANGESEDIGDTEEQRRVRFIGVDVESAVADDRGKIVRHASVVVGESGGERHVLRVERVRDWVQREKEPEAARLTLTVQDRSNDPTEEDEAAVDVDLCPPLKMTFSMIVVGREE